MSWTSWGSILRGKGKRYLRKFHSDKRAGVAIGMDRRTVESAAYLSHVSRYSGDHILALRESHFGVRAALCPGHSVRARSELRRTNVYGLVDFDIRFHPIARPRTH